VAPLHLTHSNEIVYIVNMKFLAFFFALFAAAWAAPSYIHGAAYAPSAILPAAARGLITYPNGATVPVDEPAVQAARADHLLTKGAIIGSRYGAVVAAPALVAAPAYGW